MQPHVEDSQKPQLREVDQLINRWRFQASG
jgi:hypothetical protein